MTWIVIVLALLAGTSFGFVLAFAALSAMRANTIGLTTATLDDRLRFSPNTENEIERRAGIRADELFRAMIDEDDRIAKGKR